MSFSTPQVPSMPAACAAGSCRSTSSDDPASDGAPPRDARSAEDELSETRSLIDEIDGAIVGLLHRRAELSRRAGCAKAALGIGVIDPAREASLVAARRTAAIAVDLDPDAVAE